MDVLATQIRATLGFDDAQFALWLLYYDGTGVPRDRAKGMRLIKRAADQGNANAAWTLAQAARESRVTRVPASCAHMVPSAPRAAPNATRATKKAGPPKATKAATATKPPKAVTGPKPKAQRTVNANLASSSGPSRSGRGRDSDSVSMDWEPTAPTTTTTRRRLLNTERHALSLSFGHRCADAKCRVLLPVGWHADHIVPLADCGPDDTANMQPLCPPCHMLKTARENSGRKAR